MELIYDNIELENVVKLPLPFSNYLYNSNQGAFIMPINYEDEDPIFISKFKLYGYMLIAKASSGQFLVWNLVNDDVAYYKNRAELTAYVRAEEITDTVKLEEFGEQYDAHWKGWQFWIG